MALAFSFQLSTFNCCFGGVAKSGQARACKALTRRFKSDRLLLLLFFGR